MATTIKLADLSTDHVLSVYSGKPGCACGCRGKRTYNPAFQDEGTQSRGYVVTGEECSAKVIANMIARMKNGTGVEIDEGGTLATMETDTRIHVLYLRDAFRFDVSAAAAA